MQRMIIADLSAYAVTINNARFVEACEPDRFYSVLGPPDRIVEAGDPAPAGHRNNQVHFFDDLGIYLLEHHARRTIDSIEFVFDPRGLPFIPHSVFVGQLSIAGKVFDPSLHIREFLKCASLPFKRHLRTWYHYDSEKISITLTTFSVKKTKSGRPSQVRGISGVCADFCVNQPALPLENLNGKSEDRCRHQESIDSSAVSIVRDIRL